MTKYYVHSTNAALRNFRNNNITVHIGDKSTRYVEKTDDVTTLTKELFGKTKDILSHVQSYEGRIQRAGTPSTIRAFLSLGIKEFDVSKPLILGSIWGVPLYQAIQNVLAQTKGDTCENILNKIKRDAMVGKFLKFTSGAKTPGDHKLIVISLFHTLTIHHPESGYHSEGVSSLVKAIGFEMGFSEDEIIMLGEGGLLHDIGKICVSREILNKQASDFTDHDYDVTKTHVPIGGTLHQFCGLDSIILNATWWHHIFNEDKYPAHLDLEETPDEGIICAGGDSFEAGISDRIYKKSKPPKKVFGEVEKRLSKHPRGRKVLDALKNALNHKPELTAAVRSLYQNKKRDPVITESPF